MDMGKIEIAMQAQFSNMILGLCCAEVTEPSCSILYGLYLIWFLFNSWRGFIPHSSRFLSGQWVFFHCETTTKLLLLNHQCVPTFSIIVWLRWTDLLGGYREDMGNGHTECFLNLWPLTKGCLTLQSSTYAYLFQIHGHATGVLNCCRWCINFHKEQNRWHLVCERAE